jgi:hypothetical protein
MARYYGCRRWSDRAGWEGDWKGLIRKNSRSVEIDSLLHRLPAGFGGEMMSLEILASSPVFPGVGLAVTYHRQQNNNRSRMCLYMLYCQGREHTCSWPEMSDQEGAGVFHNHTRVCGGWGYPWQ